MLSDRVLTSKSSPMVIDLEYQCRLGDYQEACRAQRPFSMARNVLVAVLFCAFITVIALIATEHGVRQGSAQVTIVALTFCLWAAAKLLRPVWVKRDFAKHPNFSLPQVVRITEEGVHTQHAVGQSDTKWPAYTKFRETQNLFILYLGARLFEVIPKRAFDPRDLDGFRKLVRQKLPAK